ncbi:MAG: 2-amino-4-hydroxy-6-hydroxymethyldihydropteridine diphosphokinase [Ignavibacteriales bacterium]|nr:2-amino-4-hydroxy-6-hydroxymethyldihydropteridine diphosphokinase [Ignavibacteriales bacterium]
MNVPIFVGLGSNLGDRLSYLHQAIDLLEQLPDAILESFSSVYQTEPVGVKHQPEFFNAVVKLRSALNPRELYQHLKRIEKTIGRTHAERWGPREIDLDLLYYGNRVLQEEGLTIPHTESANRRFVLVPMKEIAATFRDPLRQLSIAELLNACSDTSAVRKTEFSLDPQAKES